MSLRDDGGDLVKIVDFGLAEVIGSSKLTRSGMVFGTPHYMRPGKPLARWSITAPTSTRWAS